MKKKLVSTLLCVAMVSTMLAGCGGSDGAASTEGGDSAPAAEAPAFRGILRRAGSVGVGQQDCYRIQRRLLPTQCAHHP